MNMLTRVQHSEYMDNLIGGIIGKLLKEEQPELYERIQKENIWAIVNGKIKQDDNLKYLRNTIGVVQAFLDTGAIAVLDMQTFSLYSAEEFTEKIFSKELDVYSHVKILLSKMEDGNIWLHTRGIRKFGRPDVSIENIHDSDVDKAVRVANQMIYYSSLGVLFNKKTKLHTHKEEIFIVNPKFIEDYENIDFNNAYCKLLWEECEWDETTKKNIETAIKGFNEGNSLLKYLTNPGIYIELPEDIDEIGYVIQTECPWEPEHMCAIIIRENELKYVGPSEGNTPWDDDDEYYCIWNDDVTE